MFEILKKDFYDEGVCERCLSELNIIYAQDSSTEFYLLQCQQCNHQVFFKPEDGSRIKYSCHCKECEREKRNLIKHTKYQENLKISPLGAKQPIPIENISFLNKLFLLALLEEFFTDIGLKEHTEYIKIENYKYRYLVPTLSFQNRIIKDLLSLDILVPRNPFEKHNEIHNDDAEYYINISIKHLEEPTINQIKNELDSLFKNNLKNGIPYSSINELNESLFYMFHQEIMSFISQKMNKINFRFKSNKSFFEFNKEALKTLALEQIFYLASKAIDFLNSKSAFTNSTESPFKNTNIIKSTLEKYVESAYNKKREILSLKLDDDYRQSKMTQILVNDFFKYDQRAYSQPIHFLWKKVEARMRFFAENTCIHCGSKELSTDYDEENSITRTCNHCDKQSHFFIK